MSKNQAKASHSRIDKNLSFQIQSDLEKYLLKGWSAKASAQLWTVGECATLQFHVSGLSGRNIILRMECTGFLARPMLDHQSVEVLVNDVKVATWTVRKIAWHEAVVPSDLIINGDMNISLLIKNPSAPCDYNLSNDKRKLGIRVSSMEILIKEKSDPDNQASTINIAPPSIEVKLVERLNGGSISSTDIQGEKSKVERNVIWITSYPKSGNTWIHSVLRLAGKNYGFPQVDMGAYNILQKGEQPTICPAVKDQFASRPCVVLKTHSAYKKDEQLHSFSEVDLHNAAYVHIYRNPLDVLLSYLNFTKLQYKNHANSAAYKKNLFEDMLGLQRHHEYEEWLGMDLDVIPKNNLDHALDYFSDNELTLQKLAGMSGSWIEHTRSWFEAAHDMPGHSIRYEDCLENPEEFVKLCDLFGFDREDVLFALDYVNSRARSMSASENRDHAVFYNKMRAYYFTDYFSKDAISRFLNKNETLLKDCGYASIFDLV